MCVDITWGKRVFSVVCALAGLVLHFFFAFRPEPFKNLYGGERYWTVSWCLRDAHLELAHKCHGYVSFVMRRYDKQLGSRSETTNKNEREDRSLTLVYWANYYAVIFRGESGETWTVTTREEVIGVDFRQHEVLSVPYSLRGPKGP